jgi:predicted enzyme related to lactoylglutathione lyase
MEKTKQIENTIVWFEIPVKDLKRAIKFYTKVLDTELHLIEQGSTKMAFFPHTPGIVAGGLVESPDYQPSEHGTLIYLNGGPDLNVALNRVESAGGKILQKKMSIGEHGFIATFKDTEGNKIALHSMK